MKFHDVWFFGTIDAQFLRLLEDDATRKLPCVLRNNKNRLKICEIYIYHMRFTLIQCNFRSIDRIQQ
ncbi:hypothetical protein TKWG_11110 [Advenella kashmirensis WT001]|uniref:Uncharacterized protein n=1 Tax=Advenella kashmirensis (strain DSM 17095 / LMG 22695 / WT001) TaxID=1036672 RepID=I3UBQ4_ADVKW|nr:hypothetical protein TKWG_11110 [Advenella kashmirensis WT001]